MSAEYGRRKRQFLSQTALTSPPPQPIRASGHEIMHALIKALGAEVRENMGIAMAALMLKKSRDKVTHEEAVSALHDTLKISDPVYRAEVIRAGDSAMLSILSWQGIVPTAYAGDLIAGFQRLDAGETEDLGVLTPSPTSRRNPGLTATRERTVAAEVAFQMGGHKTSRDRAVQITTGVGRGNWKWTQPPTLPWGADYQVIQRAVDAGWRDNPDLKEDAFAEGKKLNRSETPDPVFMACRRTYLAEWKRETA
jgi:hypothetical protein